MHIQDLKIETREYQTVCAEGDMTGICSRATSLFINMHHMSVPNHNQIVTPLSAHTFAFGYSLLLFLVRRVVLAHMYEKELTPMQSQQLSRAFPNYLNQPK
jgi:hypothetical protein